MIEACDRSLSGVGDREGDLAGNVLAPAGGGGGTQGVQSDVRPEGGAQGLEEPLYAIKARTAAVVPVIPGRTL